ncbi:MAG: hypothetical protein V7K94_25535 [Nostoc sp.]|uniref:hypothetical protein n=1 Tax=Nostoc sp. TaxID=1180 RepID=UPI002FFB5B2C
MEVPYDRGLGKTALHPHRRSLNFRSSLVSTRLWLDVGIGINSDKKRDRSWTVSRAEIGVKNLDLKAVNPNA